MPAKKQLNVIECHPADHGFIPLFVHGEYIGIVCAKCGKRIKESE